MIGSVSGKQLRPRIFLIAGVVLILLSLPGLLELELDHSPRALLGLGKDSESGSESLRIVFRGAGLETAGGLEALEDLAARLSSLEEVKSLLSPLERHRLELETRTDPRGFWQELATTNGLDRKLGLVSPQGDAISFLLETRPLSELDAVRFFSQLEEAFKRLPGDLRGELVGERSLDLAFRASSLRVWQHTLPILGTASLLLLGLAFGSLRATFAPLCFVAAAVLPLLGVMGFSGTKLHLLLGIVPPFLFATGFATCLHVGLATQENLNPPAVPQEKAAVQAIALRSRALLGSYATTACGFLALGASPSRPVRELALWATAGLLWQAFLAFALLPALVASPAGFPLTSRPSWFSRFFGQMGAWLSGWASERSKLFLGAAFGLAFAALWGVRRLEVESNALHYLPAHHPVRERIERLEQEGFPVWKAELEVGLKGAATFRTEERLEALARFQEELAREWPAHAAVGLPEILREALGGPESGLGSFQGWETGLAALEVGSPQMAARYLDASGKTTRLTVFFQTPSAEALEAWKQKAQQLADGHFPGVHLRLTGLLPELLELQRQVLSTFFRSSVLALLPIAALLGLTIRPIRLVGPALFVNLWPCAVLLGFYGGLGGVLDVGTVLVVAILLGLTVDATLHLLTLSENPFFSSTPDSLRNAARQVAPALFASTAVLSLSFGATAASDFLPLARMGVLLVAGLITGLAADLCLLPALLVPTRRQGSRFGPGNLDQGRLRPF